MSAFLTLSVRETDDAVVVAASGEVDSSNAAQLFEALQSIAQSSRIVVDLTTCTFFDSACLSVLTRFAKQRRLAGKPFNVLANKSGRRVLEITGLIQPLHVA